MGYFRCSNGARISKNEIDKRVREAKIQKLAEQKNEFGFNFCSDCQKYGWPAEKRANNLEYRILDCSHSVSVKACQESGRSELAWDLDNITIRCRFHHRRKDGTNLKSGKL